MKNENNNGLEFRECLNVNAREIKKSEFSVGRKSGDKESEKSEIWSTTTSGNKEMRKAENPKT